MPVYAAYGNTLDPGIMRDRCPHSPLVGTGWLEGWRLTFGGADLGLDGPLPTVAEADGERVFVALYDLHPFDAPILDEWEGASRGVYRSFKARIATLDGEVTATLHVLNAYEGGLPAPTTVETIASAAEKAGAPDDYVKSLRTRPTTA